VLKKLDIKVKESPEKGKKTEPLVITLPGQDVTLFNEAKKEIALQQEVAGPLEELIKEAAVGEIIDLNCSVYKGTLSSVKLCDDEGSLALVSMTKKYADLEGPAIEAVFDRINKARKSDAVLRKRSCRTVDVNAVVQYVVVPKLNEGIFYDKNGLFRQDLYREVRRAFERLATQLKFEGNIEPDARLYTEEKKIRVRPDFHIKRWKAFTKRENVLLSRVVPSTVSIKPVVK
jgi:hypothetical protein